MKLEKLVLLTGYLAANALRAQLPPYSIGQSRCSLLCVVLVVLPGFKEIRREQLLLAFPAASSKAGERLTALDAKLAAS
jgi:hypothetical protein